MNPANGSKWRLLRMSLALALALSALAAAENTESDRTESDRTESDRTESDRTESDRENAAEQPGDEAYAFQDEVFVTGIPSDIPTSNTVAAKLPLSLRETPASVGVVGAPIFSEQDAFVLGDVLKNISGLNVQTGSGVFDFFVVRGLDSVSSGLILSDGAPEPETTFYQLYNVERVEVLKGPGAFLYGGSPLGGTVNLVRKQPLGDDFVRLGASLGSFDTYEGTIDANFANDSGSLTFRLNSLWQESEGFRDDKDSENLAINPAFTWRPNDRTSVNFNFEQVDSEYKSDAGLPILFTGEVADVPRERSYQSPFDISDQDITRFQVDFQTFFSDRFALRNKTYYRQLDWLSSGTIFNGVFPSQTGGLDVSRSLLQLDDSQEFFGNQLEGLWQITTGNVTHNLLIGVEYAQLRDEFTFDVALLPGIDLFNPVETAREPLFILPGQSLIADARTDILAPYIVDQMAFGDKFQLLLGARYDRLDFEDDATGLARDDDELSPMLGLVYLPTRNLSFYANAGEAFAPPSTFVGPQERVPEESQQFEVGIKQALWGGKVNATLAFFQIDRENIAIPDDNGITQQTGDQRSEGIEFEIAATPRRGLRALFAYAYTDAELTEFSERLQVSFAPPAFLTFDRSGNTPAFVPEHLINFWIRQQFNNGFGIGGGLRYVDEQFIAEDNAFAIDDYLTVDAAFFYTRGPWRLNLNLKNLTDEDYFTRGFGGTSVIPAPGATLSSGFEYTF